MMTTARILAGIAAALLAQGAAAQILPQTEIREAVAEKATTEIKVFSASRQKTVWAGEGTGVIAAELCVASTTGRFRLQIASQSGGALIGPGKLPYSIHFRDGGGLDHVERVDGQSIVTFEGNAPNAANCDAGPNATLAIETTEGDMLGQAAGEYFDRLRLTASPL